MKSLSIATLICSALLGLISHDLSAQSLLNHPDDPNAKRIDTISVTIDLSSSAMMSQPSSTSSGPASSGGATPSQSTSSYELRSLVIVWRTSDGRADYTLDPSSIQCNGPAIDTYATPILTEMIARAAVLNGVARGYTPCTGSTATPSVVYRNSCIYRTGSGSATRFLSCNPSAFCRYAFVASCGSSGTTPTLTDLPVANRCDDGTSGTAAID